MENALQQSWNTFFEKGKGKISRYHVFTRFYDVCIRFPPDTARGSGLSVLMKHNRQLSRFYRNDTGFISRAICMIDSFPRCLSTIVSGLAVSFSGLYKLLLRLVALSVRCIVKVLSVLTACAGFGFNRFWIRFNRFICLYYSRFNRVCQAV